LLKAARGSVSSSARCTASARALEEEGIVERQTFPEVPPRVEYALTEKGRALVPLIEDMRSYGREWLGAECPEPERLEKIPGAGRESVVAAA
jgi:DNA-binding HxlR family transcriptional regulator